MSFRIHQEIDQGMNIMYGMPDKRLRGLSMGLVRLGEGDRFGETLNKREAVLVLLQGRIVLRGQGYDLGELEAPEDFAAGPVAAAYCPPGLFAFKAATPVELLVLRSEVDAKAPAGEPSIIADASVRTDSEGGVTRHLLRDDADDARFRVGLSRIDTTALPADGEPLSRIVGETGATLDRDGLLYFRCDASESDARVRLFDADGADAEETSAGAADAIVLPAGLDAALTGLDCSCICVWALGACSGVAQQG